MSYLTYSDSRTSNVEWIGEIPQHWHVSYVRRFYDVDLGKMVNQAAQNGSGTVKPYLRAANIHWGRIDIDDVNEMEFTPDQLQRYRLAKGDLLVTEGGVTVGRSAIWGGQIDECYYQNSLNRVRPKNSRQSVEFLYYWMYFTKSNGYVDLITNNATFNHLTNEKLLAFPILEIPFEEQIAIANFLDHETAKIDTLIAKQQRLIELLQEKRQALISHAVTKGLNPDAPMKESGIEWLGEIPAHWKVSPLKHLATVRTGVAKGRDLTGQDTIEVPYLRVANVQDGYLDLSDVALITIARHELERYSLQNGDVLMNEGGDNDKLGRGHVWRGEIEPCIHQNHVFAVRPKEIDSEWLNFITGTDYAKFYFYSFAKQSTNLASISSRSLQELPVICPPIQERNQILEYVKNETERIDSLTDKSRRAVNLLQERRSSLISAAVTGKIDVRGYNTTPESSYEPETQRNHI